jgi:hypothetical protein
VARSNAERWNEKKKLVRKTQALTVFQCSAVPAGSPGNCRNCAELVPAYSIPAAGPDLQNAAGSLIRELRSEN